MSPGVNQTVTVPMKFTKQEINKSITFYYEPVRLTVRHYNMTNSTENPVKIITSNNITKEFIPFNQLALVNGKVQIPPKIDFDTYSLSKFWWPAYNLEYVTMSTIEDSNLNANSFRKITFHPYKVFAPTAKDPAQCASIVNSTTSIGNAIRQIYEIDADAEKDLIIDIIKNMATDADQNEAKRQLASANNLLVYARLKDVDLIEDISEIRKQSEANISSTKLVSALEDCLLSKGDKESQIKKKITLPYAPEITGKISEFPAYRSDKYVKYYYTTTEIMVNNINLETEEFIQSLPDNNNNTYDMRTKVPIRDTQFRAESLITTPPAREDLKYSYSVYNPTDKTFTRRQYDITGYVLEKFDIKVGDEVILSVTASDAEEWYTIDGSASTLYPPFSEQFIIDTSTPGGIGSYINATLSQLDLNRLDKDASVNFYYRDVSLLKIKYVRDTDFAEILPSKTKILSTEKEYISPEKIKNYEYDSYILDGNKGEGTKVEVVELPNGQDRELIFIYKVPQLDPTLDFADRQYVDLRSNDRVPASDIMQEEYQTAEPRLKNGKYSDKYKSLEEYNTYNDKERKNDQSNEGIPTLEDLYANVVANQFLVDNALTMQPTTQKLKLKIVRKYYKTNKADSDKTNDDDNVNNQITDKVGIIEVDVETELPYQYYGASGADLKVIENAMVYNNVIDQVELKPNYKLPEMNYIKNGYLYLPVKRSYDDEIRKYTEGVKKGEEDFRNLKSGFYSVVNPTSRTDTLEAVWVIEGIDAYMAGEKESEKIERITREYKDSAFVLLALQEAGTLVHPDKLTITYYSSADGKSKPKEYLIVKDGINKENLNENMKLNITYTAEMLEDMGILYSEDIPLTGTDVLYKNRDLYVKSKTKNGTHGTEGKFGDKYKDNTVAEVNYILHQTIKNEEVVGGPAAKSLQEALGSEYQARFDDARRTKTIIGHPVVVHTPVVNASKFDFDGKNNDYDYSEPNKHTVNEIKGKNGTLVLGQKFDIEIPHKGQHIDAVGYGNNTYNYEGLIANGQTTSSIDGNLFNGVKDKFAIIKQIKFDKVGVILYEKDEYGHVGGGKYYTKNEWINLPLEDEIYTFTIPEWEEEIWDDREVTIETRVAAENIPNDEDKKYYETTESFNGLKPKYGVWKTFKFKVIGELKDLEIRATNDPGYSGYKTGGTSSMPIGQKGQGNGGAAYQYGIKLGYSVYFDIMSTGWTGDTTESVEISPTFYYVGKNGGKADKVDLYYKVTGNPNYVKLEGTGARNLTTIMSTDAVRGPRCKSVYALWANRVYGTGSGFFNANAGQEMANTTKFITALKAEASNYVETKNKPTVNYGLPIGTGTTNAIKLPYSVRLAYTNAVNAMLSQKYAGVTGLEVVSNNAKNYCIGHWYGAYKLPATTVAVEPGVTPKPDKSNTKKNGYIIVVFENVHSNKGTPGPGEKDYLKTDPDQYKSEGANIKNNYPFDLPNGNPAYVPNPQLGVPEPNYIPAIIYETDIAANQDAEIAGTH